MAVVKLPNGQNVRFPDDMPMEEIKALIASKFPEEVAARQASSAVTADTLMNLAREQFTPDPAAQPQVEGNPYASSLPGPLGQFQNSSRAFQGGMIEGATGNLSNEITSGIMAPFDAAGAAMQGNGFDVGRSFNNIYAQGQEQAAGSRALNPELYNRGNLTGAVTLGGGLGSLASRATSPLATALLGGLEGGLYGAVYGAGGAEGNERLSQALQQAGWGAAGGSLLGGVAGAMQQPISQEARLINRGLKGDGIDPAAIPGQTANLGPAGIVGDLGPNLQAQTAAIATIPGRGSQKVSAALGGRRAAANERIKNDVTGALGTPPRLSQVAGEIDDARKVINQQYEPVFRAKALSDDPFVDVSPLVNALDNRLSQTVGETKAAVQKVRNLLTDENGAPIQDPQMVMAVRQELDGMIGSETNRTIKSALVEARKEIDRTLGQSVPGLKQVDAQFAEISDQGAALERGGDVLRTDKGAIDPADLVDEMITNTTGQNMRLDQGVRAEINRIIGTNANDRVALRNIVRGEGSWNADKLKTILGEERADALMRIIDREATMAATENLATSGSRTQVLKAAQEEIAGKTGDPSVMREALNFQYGNAAARLSDKLLGGALARRREGVVSNVADVLLGQGLSPKMSAEIARLNNGASKRDKLILSLIMSGQASQ